MITEKRRKSIRDSFNKSLGTKKKKEFRVTYDEPF